ncbi:MAG: bifunctional DNA primase/polymerase [Planctomycetaceae bacterium]|nr:bifunctional DNA primase/polymerase [Planctomycetaceae bacterium]
MTDMFDAAFEYRDMGLSVIPLNGKVPAFNWKEFQERLATFDEIKSWFRKSAHNIGIVTGQVSGVMAFDVDSYDTAKQFFAQDLPKSQMMTRSGNGRGHVYYRIQEDLILGNRVRIKGMGALDIRAEGGQCVAAPSIHPISGQQYQKVGTWNLQDVPYFDPAWIDDEIIEPPKWDSKAPVSVPNREGGITDLDSYLAAVSSIQGQNGSKGLFRVCCIARNESGSLEEAYEYVKRWNE